MKRNTNKRNQSGSKGNKRNTGNKFSNKQRDIESLDMRTGRVPLETRRANEDLHTGKPNDPRWYAQNPQLMKDYASFPFNVPVGNVLPSIAPTGTQVAVPGVMAYYFTPTVGWSDNANSPINMAMRQIYSYVRHANSGASNYDAPDLMLYLVAVDSVLMLHSYMKRLYSTMNEYTPINRYYPKALVQAMGAKFDDFMVNLNDFRGFINQYAVKASSLWIPNSMSYMARHSWMCEGLYTDSVAAKAQTYLYVPGSFYKFTLDSQGAGSLVSTPLPGTPVQMGNMTYQQLVDFANGLINPLLANEDIGIMSGDILKAFGESGIVKVNGITEDYRVLPVYNMEVLSQMENLTIGALSGANITQTTAVGTGYLVSKPTYAYGLSLGTGAQQAAVNAMYDRLELVATAPHILNMHHDGVSPEEVMVASRLTNIMSNPENVSTGTNVAISGQLKCAGSEVVYNAVMFLYIHSGGELSLGMYNLSTINSLSVVSTDAPSATLAKIGRGISTLAILAQFDWHPLVYFMHTFNNDGEVVGEATNMPIGDVDNYAIVGSYQLEQMSVAALLSEFTVPQVG